MRTSARFRIIILFVILFFLQYSSYGQYSTLVNAPVNMPDKQETEPYISLDGKSMVFIAIQNNTTLLYETKKDNAGNWQTPMPIDIINNFKPNARISSPVYNYDASEIYFDANFSDTSGVDIYLTKKINGQWTSPVNLGGKINTKGYDGHPSVSVNDLVLYFVRENLQTETDRKDCKKMMVSYRLPGGEWEAPKELQVPLNLDCEMWPRIMADNKTLYISSERMGGKGGLDLYYAKEVANNVWLVPIRIDTLNTEFDETAASIPAAGNQIYYSIFSTEKKKNISGIYTMDLPSQFKPEKVLTVTGKITDLYTKTPVSAQIIVTNPNTSQILSVFKNDPQTGEYTYFLASDKDYKIDYSANNFSHVFKTLTTKSLKENQTENINLELYSYVTLILNVYDKEIFEPQAAKINITDINTGQTASATTESISTGRFNIKMPIGKKYKIDISKEYFESNSLIFDLTGVVQFDEFERDIELTSLKHRFEFTLTDDATNQGIIADIEITNLSTNEKFKTTASTDKNGKATVYLRKGDQYSVNISPKGYSFYNTDLNLDENKPQEKLEVKLTALKEETKLTLNNITFETNSAELNSSSFEEIDRVVKLMTINPAISIEISAHTDDVGSDKYNLKLSDRRAQSVVNYLVEKEIPQTRMISKGYGETKPKVPNDSDANRAVNRRVELRIVEISN